MATKNIEICINTGTSYEILYPKTKWDNIINQPTIPTVPSLPLSVANGGTGTNSLTTFQNNLINTSGPVLGFCKVNYTGTMNLEAVGNGLSQVITIPCEAKRIVYLKIMQDESDYTAPVAESVRISDSGDRGFIYMLARKVSNSTSASTAKINTTEKSFLNSMELWGFAITWGRKYNSSVITDYTTIPSNQLAIGNAGNKYTGAYSSNFTFCSSINSYTCLIWYTTL